LNVIDSLLSLHRVPPVCRAASTNEPNDGESSQPKALDDASGLSPREVSAVLGMASAVALSMETALSAGDATMGRPDYNKTQNRHRIQRRNSFVIHRNKGGAGCFLSSMSLDQTTHTRTTRTAPMSRRHSMDSLIMPPPPARTKECIREMP
jgi:hypothetical protein